MKKLNLPWLKDNKPTNVVIYKKTKSSKKYNMIITNIHLDVISNLRATKPIIPHKYDIIEMGVGYGFIESYAKTYKITKPEIIVK